MSSLSLFSVTQISQQQGRGGSDVDGQERREAAEEKNKDRWVKESVEIEECVAAWESHLSLIASVRDK